MFELIRGIFRLNLGEYIYIYIYIYGGQAVAQLVEALLYKTEGRGFDSRWYHWNLSLT